MSDKTIATPITDAWEEANRAALKAGFNDWPDFARNLEQRLSTEKAAREKADRETQLELNCAGDYKQRADTAEKRLDAALEALKKCASVLPYMKSVETLALPDRCSVERKRDEAIASAEQVLKENQR